MSINELKFGITYPFDCSYIDGLQERLLVATDDIARTPANYSQLVSLGFRRSATQIYRPHCEYCNACKSIRIPVDAFKPSNSQKRNLKRNNELQVKLAQNVQENYYPLYEHYVNTTHKDGAMYPANTNQFESFLGGEEFNQLFIECWLGDELISVAICDLLINGLSALYTFYQPAYRQRGLGTFSILKQIDFCQHLGLKHLYLGYQIDACSKMNYKANFKPHEIFADNQWNLINK